MPQKIFTRRSPSKGPNCSSSENTTSDRNIDVNEYKDAIATVKSENPHLADIPRALHQMAVERLSGAATAATVKGGQQRHRTSFNSANNHSSNYGPATERKRASEPPNFLSGMFSKLRLNHNGKKSSEDENESEDAEINSTFRTACSENNNPISTTKFFNVNGQELRCLAIRQSVVELSEEQRKSVLNELHEKDVSDEEGDLQNSLHEIEESINIPYSRASIDRDSASPNMSYVLEDEESGNTTSVRGRNAFGPSSSDGDKAPTNRPKIASCKSRRLRKRSSVLSEVSEDKEFVPFGIEGTTKDDTAGDEQKKKVGMSRVTSVSEFLPDEINVVLKSSLFTEQCVGSSQNSSRISGADGTSDFAINDARNSDNNQSMRSLMSVDSCNFMGDFSAWQQSQRSIFEECNDVDSNADSIPEFRGAVSGHKSGSSLENSKTTVMSNESENFEGDFSAWGHNESVKSFMSDNLSNIEHSKNSPAK